MRRNGSGNVCRLRRNTDKPCCRDADRMPTRRAAKSSDSRTGHQGFVEQSVDQSVVAMPTTAQVLFAIGEQLNSKQKGQMRPNGLLGGANPFATSRTPCLSS